MNWRDQTDEQFLAGCRWEAFRGSGPGGQKRNKTSSAVRITHEPTGLSATASESRSQAENRARALRRLRMEVVLENRETLDAEAFAPPAWFESMKTKNSRLDVSRKHERYLAAIGLVFDVLSMRGWSVSDAARDLRITTANLVSFLQEDEKVWAKLNQMRASVGLRTLNA